MVIDEGELRKKESTDVCEECFGTGTKLDPVKGAIPCPCRRRDRSRKLITAARIPRSLREVFVCKFHQRSRKLAGPRAESRTQTR